MYHLLADKLFVHQTMTVLLSTLCNISRLLRHKQSDHRYTMLKITIKRGKTNNRQYCRNISQIHDHSFSRLGTGTSIKRGRVKVIQALRYITSEEFEDTKGAIRIRISKKNRQHNGQKKKYKRRNNVLQNVHIKLKIE